jgi:hypothetical protein
MPKRHWITKYKPIYKIFWFFRWNVWLLPRRIKRWFWDINIFGFVTRRMFYGDFSRTAWSLEIGHLRFVEWPWDKLGVHVQWKYKTIYVSTP